MHQAQGCEDSLLDRFCVCAALLLPLAISMLAGAVLAWLIFSSTLHIDSVCKQ
jgi:hypothetical protein